MFDRKTRSTMGRRLVDHRGPCGVPWDVVYIVFALGLLAGVWFARRETE